MKQLTYDNFNQALEGRAIIDFWASWCGPCRVLHPLLERLEQEHGVEIYSVNVDEEPVLAGQYRIMSIPSVIVLEDGQVTNQMVGVRPYPDLVHELVKS